MSNTKNEVSSYQQSGFICLACGNHTKTYNGFKPTQCPHCSVTGQMKMEWNQKLETTSVVTELPLDN